MSKTLRATTAVTAIVAAGLIAGCASPNSHMQVSGGFAKPADLGKLGLATRALAALQAGDKDEALRFAERAVEASPDDAGFRTLLGNIYMAQGRFASAETSFKDSLTLLPGQSPVAMKLVLAQIAQGKNEAALGLLDQLRGSADPADVGLAMALAGQPGNAVALLDEAARRPEADARTRQNLALAHAMAGDWANARVVAAQDVPADQVEARIAEWMKTATSNSGPTQVASLLGVTPAASDPGQPVRLALRDRGDVRMAAAAPVSTPVEVAANAAPTSNDQTVINDPGFAAPAAPVATAPVAAAASTVTVALPAATPAPEEAGPLADVAQNLESLRHEAVSPSGALPKVSELRRTAAIRFANSGVVVQLGAYGSQNKLEAGWAKLSRSHKGVLGRYVPATARFHAPIGQVYRLSLQGFGSMAEAREVCEGLKNAGAACFVRHTAGDAPVAFASR